MRRETIESIHGAVLATRVDALEGQFTMTLAQARSTRAPRGRKWDKADAKRNAKRLLSGDLTVSYVPAPEQRDWRLLMRTQVAMHESVVRVRNQIEVLLEQAQMKLSSVVTYILDKSARRMLDALVRGLSDPVELNQVEIWFSKVERDVIARGIFTSVNDLARKLRRYINAYSANAKPIRWKYFDPTRRIRSTNVVPAECD